MTNTTPKPVVGYVRVSTEGQATEGVSMEAQRAKIQAWCLANDHAEADIYTDAGLSGGRADNRPELQRALADVCKRRGVLVVYSLSRLSRSTKDTIQIGERLEKAGADLVSLSERIDTTSAAGRMIFKLLAVLAEFERDQICERTRMAMAHKKSQGRRVGTVPFGYDLAPDGATLVENPHERRVIRWMRLLQKSGESLRSIAKQLNNDGIRPKGNGPTWHASAVRSVLERESVTV